MKLNTLKTSIILIQLLTCNYLMAQTDLKIVCYATPDYYYYFYNGIRFAPTDSIKTKLHNESTLCKNYKCLFNLYGVIIEEDIFKKLHIKQKDVFYEKSIYNGIYKNNDKTNCIEKIILFVNISLPFKLNGVGLNPNSKLNEKLNNKEFTISRKKRFSRNSFIEIKANLVDDK